jgi:hypothetical protein
MNTHVDKIHGSKSKSVAHKVSRKQDSDKSRLGLRRLSLSSRRRRLLCLPWALVQVTLNTCRRGLLKL